MGDSGYRRLDYPLMLIGQFSEYSLIAVMYRALKAENELDNPCFEESIN